MDDDKIGKWLERAKLDLQTARYLLEGEYYLDAVFHAQQSVEKALKALYLKKFNELVKTHELVFLAKKVDAPNEILELCEALNPFFVQTRYPDYEEEITAEEAEKIIKDATMVIKWTEMNL